MAKNLIDKKVDWVIDQLILRRKALGISHEKLANKIKLSRSAIGLIENRQRTPTISTVFKICDALGVSLASIIADYESDNA